MKSEDNGEEDQAEEWKEVMEFTAIPESPEISLHALLESLNPRTMKVKEKWRDNGLQF